MSEVMSAHDEMSAPHMLAARLRLSMVRLSRQLRRMDPSELTIAQFSALATVVRSGPLGIGHLAEIEGLLRMRLTERGADSTKTDAGTAYFSNIMNTKIESVPLLFDFVADNWDDLGADTKISLPVGKVREYMDAHDAQPPPGMSISYFNRLNIKRS